MREASNHRHPEVVSGSISPLALSVIGALFFVSCASAIAATDDMEERFKTFSNPRGEANLRKHANCIAQRYASEVQILLRNDLGMKEITSNYKNLLNFKCTDAALFRDNSVTLSDLNYPQALAEAALVKDYSSKTVAAVDRVPPLKRDEFPAFDDEKLPQKFRDSLAVSRYFHDLDVIAECAARKEPQTTFVIFGTALNSPEEALALNAVKPALTVCGVPKLRPQPPAYFLRGALAKNLYRLADELHPVDELRETEH